MKTVFHLISDDRDDQKTTLTLAGNLLEDDSVDVDDIVVVAQAGGIAPVTVGDSGEAEVRELMEGGVTFKACSNTLEMMDIDEDELVEGVETVPSGVGELTRLQNDGYAYIRP